MRISNGGKNFNDVSNVVQISSVCFVKTNGDVTCFEDKFSGLTGFEYLDDIVQISVGNKFKCAVTKSGEVYCWRFVPVEVLGGEQGGKYLKDIVQVSVSGKYVEVDKFQYQNKKKNGHACAVTTNGEVYCWGNNFYGQLGNGKEEYSKVPVRVLGGEQGGNFLKNVSQIFINGGQDYPYDYQACALTTNEEIYCWGGTDKEEFLAPVRVFSSEDKKNYLIKTVYESEYCTVTGEGKKYCLNKEFQKIIFDKIRSSSNNSTCSTHWNYSKVGEICPSGKKYKCYEKDGNFSVVCPYRKLRKNVKADDSDKTKISFESISTGLNHACGITKDNNKFLYCWGDNLFGELGNNSLRYSLKVEPIPVQVLGGEQGGKYLRDIKGVSAGYAHTCAVTIKGEVYCWGNNECGQLGRSKNPYPVSSSLPLKVIGGRQGGEYLKDIVQVSAGYNHTCAVTTNGEVYCWGDRKHIKKKYIKNTSYVPIKILGGEQGGKYLQDIKQVSSSFNKDRYYSYCHDNCTCYVCALTTKGEVYCWGDNKDLGLGNVKKGNSLVPVKVDGGEQGGKYLQDISKIYLGNSYTCAITKNKEAYCWGRLREKRKVLVPEKVIDNIEQIYIEQIPYGYDFFALTTNGKVFCPYKDSLPVKSISRDFGFFKKGGEQRKKYLKNVVQISSGGDFSCALTDNGSAYCWGNSHFGQLGNGMGIGHVIKYDGPTEVVIDPSKVL